MYLSEQLTNYLSSPICIWNGIKWKALKMNTLRKKPLFFLSLATVGEMEDLGRTVCPKVFIPQTIVKKKIEWLLFPKECFFSKRACERFWSFLIFDPNRTGSFKSDSKLFNKCKIWQYFKIDHIPFCFMLIKSIVKKIICESMLVKMLQSQNFCFILKHF